MLITSIIACKKKETAATEPVVTTPKTYNLNKTFVVYDSVPYNIETLSNYKFKVTVFKNNQPDKVIYSDNNKIYFENFTLGKYDIQVEDPLNNFSSFRDTINIDSINIGTPICVGRYPNFKFKRASTLEDSSSLGVYLFLNHITKRSAYSVYFNNVNTFIDITKKRLVDKDSHESSNAYSSNPPYNPTYFIQGGVGNTPGDTMVAFTIYKQAFMQEHNFNPGDSVYFFILPATNNYYNCSYIMDYTISQKEKSAYGKNYTGINKNGMFTVKYKFH